MSFNERLDLLRNKANKILTKKVKAIIFLLMLIILTIIIIKNIKDMDIYLIIKYWWISLLLVISAICFSLIKALNLFLAGKLFHVQKGFFHFVKVFCVSCFIELTTFTGKIGADGFKYYLWKDLSSKSRVSLLLFLRSADISGFVWVALFVFLPWKIATAVIVFVLGSLFIHFREKVSSNNRYNDKNKNSENKKSILCSLEPESFRKTLREHWGLWITMSLLTTIVYLIMVIQFSLVFSVFGLKITTNTFFVILSSHALGVISQLPFGLGVKDFSIFYQLKGIISHSNIILGLLWVRLFGEFVTILFGGLFVWMKLKK
ncbi:MAG: hypothetical protein ABIG89_01460 [Candidatus Woesearchaeota archaeon]